MTWTAAHTDQLVQYAIIAVKQKMLCNMIVEQVDWVESILGPIFVVFASLAAISGLTRLITESEIATYFMVGLSAITAFLSNVLKKNKRAKLRAQAKHQADAYNAIGHELGIEILKTEHIADPVKYLEDVSVRLVKLFADNPIISEKDRQMFVQRMRDKGFEADDDAQYLRRLLTNPAAAAAHTAHVECRDAADNREAINTTVELHNTLGRLLNRRKYELQNIMVHSQHGAT